MTGSQHFYGCIYILYYILLKNLLIFIPKFNVENSLYNETCNLCTSTVKI